MHSMTYSTIDHSKMFSKQLNSIVLIMSVRKSHLCEIPFDVTAERETAVTTIEFKHYNVLGN